AVTSRTGPVPVPSVPAPSVAVTIRAMGLLWSRRVAGDDDAGVPLVGMGRRAGTGRGGGADRRPRRGTGPRRRRGDLPVGPRPRRGHPRQPAGGDRPAVHHRPRDRRLGGGGGPGGDGGGARDAGGVRPPRVLRGVPPVP